jgi:hypothetical protein
MWNQAAIYRRRRRTFAVSVVLVLLLLVIVITAPGGGGPLKRVVKGVKTLPMSDAPLTYHPAAALLAPIRASAATRIPGKTAFTLLGGLDSSDNATAGVGTVTSSSTTVVGYLPASLFAAAAVTVGGDEYLFGGAEGTATDPVPQPYIYSYAVNGTQAVAEVAELPTGNYGLGAALVGGTVYLIGGDTGSATLDTILSWKPHGSAPQSVATLPVALRYSAVATVGEDIVIAGGLTTAGTASDAVYVFDTVTDKVRELSAKLPVGLYAAAGAALGNLAYVLGGAEITAGSRTPLATIYSVNPATGQLARAGNLQYPVAEESATVVGQAIAIAGGLSDGNAVSYDGTLTAHQAATTTTTKSKH